MITPIYIPAGRVSISGLPLWAAYTVIAIYLIVLVFEIACLFYICFQDRIDDWRESVKKERRESDEKINIFNNMDSLYILDCYKQLNTMVTSGINCYI